MTARFFKYVSILPTLKTTSAMHARARVCREPNADEARLNDEEVSLQDELLELLFMETQSIINANTHEQAARQTLCLLQRYIPFESASVLLAGINDVSLRFVAATGPFAEAVSEMQVPLDGGLAGFVFQTGCDVIVEDVAIEDRHLEQVDAQTGYQTRTMLASALMDEDCQHFGCVELLNPTRPFSARDLQIVRTIARPLANYLSARTNA